MASRVMFGVSALAFVAVGTGGPTGRRPAPFVSAGAQHAAVARFARIGRAVYCGGTRGRYVALTFDDGPGPRTAATVRLLRRAGQRATFFLVGRELASYPTLPGRELALGALGDHTWSHAPLTYLAPPGVDREIERGRSSIERLTGSRVRLFRPPYGFHDVLVDRHLRTRGLLQVLWNVDSRDSFAGGRRPAADIAAHVVPFLQPGAIILLHENRPGTLEALRSKILPALRRRGLRSVSVPELLALDPPRLTQLHRRSERCPVAVRS